ncbi:hypothetical protein [Clostridium sp.]|uniref:hypothetical protein n=1 Tax=Clostridium sp. TaxID=1506 RepID=UPI002FC5AAB5
MSISMINFKVGDKVVKANGEKWTGCDEYREIVWVGDNGTECQLKLCLNIYPTSKLKLYKPNHKNYIEVLTNIKAGEVWTSLDNNNIITKSKEGVVGITNGAVSAVTRLDIKIKYTLTKTLVTFQEAFLAYENRREIVSEVDNKIFIKCNNEYPFKPEQIRGLWFVND